MKTLQIGCLIFILISGAVSADDGNKIALTLDTSSEVLVKAFIDPIADSGSNFHLEWAPLAKLKAAELEKQYPASVFEDFLPAKRVFLGAVLPDKAVAVGEIWRMKQQDGIFELLKQLHPKPDLDMGGVDVPGGWACLRGYNAKIAEIAFRVHAEFVLEGGSLTPSQFAGKLVISRGDGKVVFFRMHVPKGAVNFDAKRMHKNSNSYGTDSGFLPRMELLAGTENNDTRFDVSITQEAASRKLTAQFYKSQQIHWVAMEQALELAQMHQKPVHVVSIDGPLTDESC